MDMGCNKKLPYGAASLEHFLNASRVLLPYNRNVFMMTDDPKWLKAEIRKYYAARKQGPKGAGGQDTMHIFTPSIRPNHRGGTFNSSIDFWASVTIARQCQGKSTVSRRVANADFNYYEIEILWLELFFTISFSGGGALGVRSFCGYLQ